MIKQVVWNSMVDYPGRLSTVLFFGKCNFNCKYCYNQELLKMKDLDFDKDILSKLLKRKECINHVILSGGECTLDNDFEYVLNKLYDEGFNIGIHTNGYLPKVILNNIDKISYFGIDIKTTKDKYAKLTRLNNIEFDNMLESIKIVLDNNKEYEVRTTLYPEFVDKQDCIDICNILKGLNVDKYYLQQYKDFTNTGEVKPYSEEYIKEIELECNKIIHTIYKQG